MLDVSSQPAESFFFFFFFFSGLLWLFRAWQKVFNSVAAWIFLSSFLLSVARADWTWVGKLTQCLEAVRQQICGKCIAQGIFSSSPFSCMLIWCCVCVYVSIISQDCFCTDQGCSVRFFGSKGSIKFVKVLEPSNCSKGLMCNFRKRALGLLPPPSDLPN